MNLWKDKPSWRQLILQLKVGFYFRKVEYYFFFCVEITINTPTESFCVAIKPKNYRVRSRHFWTEVNKFGNGFQKAIAKLR